MDDRIGVAAEEFLTNWKTLHMKGVTVDEYFVMQALIFEKFENLGIERKVLKGVISSFAMVIKAYVEATGKTPWDDFDEKGYEEALAELTGRDEEEE